MKKLKFLLLLLSIPLLVVLGQGILVLNEEPKKSDVIIVLSDDDGGRLIKAAMLYYQGYSERVLLSNSNSKSTNVENALDFGIPSKTLLTEQKATSTYTNALYTKEIMMSNNLKSAIVVSSDYHLTRTKLVFDRVYKGTGIEFTYIASETPWYVDERSIRGALREFIKLPGYYLGVYKFIDI